MYQPGDFLLSLDRDSIHLLQVLERNDDDYLVKDFWEAPTVNEPVVRTWVKRISGLQLEQFAYTFLKNEPLVERDFIEIKKFLEIEEGLNHRRNRTASMAALVNNAIQAEELDKALELLTEWAMLEKYKPEIYLLREACLRKLGRNPEADYERHVYNTLAGK